MMTRTLMSAFGLALTVVSCLHAADPIALATYLGTSGEEKANGIVRQSDGILVVVGTLGTKQLSGVTQQVVSDATATSPGYVMRIAADGESIVSLLRLPTEVSDVAIDSNDVIHVACGSGGYRVISSSGTTQLRNTAVTNAWRVDVASDGRAVVLKQGSAWPKDDPGSGTILTFGTDGASVGSFSGHRNTQDVCYDGGGNRVIAIGWRQASAFDGSSSKPVQIAYMRAYSANGAIAWTNYDWSSTTSDANFINKNTNNMADTRGYRCAMGADGYLYGAFEAAGGNHIFRLQPQDLDAVASFAGGDNYHTFSNTRSEHKTVFGRYNPSTGAAVKMQQFLTRLNSGAGNAARVKDGSISADATGRVMVTGAAASGLPLSFNPLASDAYTGGGFVLVMSTTMATRELCTRFSTGGAASAAVFTNSSVAVVGSTKNDLPVTNAFQSAHGGGTLDGFAAIVAVTASGSAPVTPPVIPPSSGGGSSGGGSSGGSGSSSSSSSGGGGCGNGSGVGSLVGLAVLLFGCFLRLASPGQFRRRAD